MRALLLIALAIVLAAPAAAHSWYSQKRDPVTDKPCCGGEDCAPLVIVPGVLGAEAAGYRVRLTLEEAQRINPKRTEPLDILIPWARVQPSEDGNFHLCIPSANYRTTGDFYCFFAPPNT